MRCLRCMAENAGTRRFCAECGSPLPSQCSACGFENEPAAKFCGGCGKPMAQGGPATPISVSAATRTDAERRQLSVMFCDVVGSTPLSSRLDPEDLRDVLGAYHDCVAKTIGRFDGFVARYMGDGVLVYFGYPQAHEHDAERAVRAGLSLIEAVRHLQAPERLRIRIGIATGWWSSANWADEARRKNGTSSARRQTSPLGCRLSLNPIRLSSHRRRGSSSAICSSTAISAPSN